MKISLWKGVHLPQDCGTLMIHFVALEVLQIWKMLEMATYKEFPCSWQVVGMRLGSMGESVSVGSIEN